jgi:Phage integrase family
MILIAFRHGLRAAEFCDLRWGQVDFDGAVLHVRRVKNDTPSTHPMQGDEMRALRRLLRESKLSSFLFVSSRGAPFTTAGFARMIERAARRGLELELKATRTCFGTPATTRSPKVTTRGRFGDGWGIVDHEHGGVLGLGAESVQGFLAGVSVVGACDDRGAGLRAGGVAGCTDGSEFL